MIAPGISGGVVPRTGPPVAIPVAVPPAAAPGVLGVVGGTGTHPVAAVLDGIGAAVPPPTARKTVVAIAGLAGNVRKRAETGDHQRPSHLALALDPHHQSLTNLSEREPAQSPAQSNRHSTIRLQ